MKNQNFTGNALTRVELKSIRGGNVPLPNTYLCDCGPNTMMDVYGTSVDEVLFNYRSSIGTACPTHATVTCVPDDEDPA